jgi:hypothetical protein
VTANCILQGGRGIVEQQLIGNDQGLQTHKWFIVRERTLAIVQNGGPKCRAGNFKRRRGLKGISGNVSDILFSMFFLAARLLFS